MKLLNIVKKLAGNHLFKWDNYMADSVYKGAAISGAPVVTMVDNRIFKGLGIQGTPLYTVNGNRLYRGTSTGSPLATLEDNRIFLGLAKQGDPLATIVDNKSYKGLSVFGSPIATTPSNNKLALFAATYHILKG